MADQLHDERIKQMRTQILRVLNRVSGGLLEENILFADMNLHLSPRAELSEFRDEILMLRDMGLIVTVRDHQLPSRKVRITAAGRAVLAEANAD
jgi:hypothetical protein